MPGKMKIFQKILMEKIEIFQKFAGIKSKFFGSLPGKIEFF